MHKNKMVTVEKFRMLSEKELENVQGGENAFALETFRRLIVELFTGK